LPTNGQTPVDFLLPGIFALAIMSTAMVSLGIATGFERSYSVLKRLGATPLGTGRLIIAKSLAVVLIEILQLVVLYSIAVMLGSTPCCRALCRHYGFCGNWFIDGRHPAR
jgi:ABC-2 type transport system permease protein